MDKIFKNKFEKFEPQVPKEMFGKIMDQIHQQPTIASSKGISKLWIYGISASILAFVTAFVLWSKNAPTENIQKNTLPLTIAKNITNIKKDANQEKKETTKTKTTNNFKSATKIKGNTNKQVKENTNKKETSKNNKPDINNTNEESHKNLDVKKKTEHIKIIAQRYSCNKSCVLELSEAKKGKWHSTPTVNIQKISETVYSVSYEQTGSIFFTYETTESKDTFTVFFRKPVSLDHSVIAENCNQSDGKIIFNTDTNLKLISLDNYLLKDKQIKGLKSGIYKLKLKDQYQCEYTKNIEIPNNKIDVSIETDALHYAVGYPVYFKAKTTQKGLTYNWQFGDGNNAVNINTNNQYTKAGEYTIVLEVSSDNCPTQYIKKVIQIEDGPIEIPNVFTPNNDGKNDNFTVNLPEGTISFEAFVLTIKGELIYKLDQQNKIWDGRRQDGQEAPSGSYLYILRGKDSTNKSFEYKSIINLIR